MLRTSLAAAAALTLTVGVAQAATVTFDATPTTNSDNPILTPISGSTLDNVTASVPNVARSPWEGGDPADDGFTFSSVTGEASIDFGFDALALSFVWGSPDDYNTVSLLDDGVEVFTYTYPVNIGANIADSLFTVTGVLFDTVVFTSGQPAFEFANLQATPVPLPAAGLLLLTALGGVAALRRRKAA